ncbi:MCE family protein [Jatrophihabitans sp.]|uniref:MCE family protein n=1 Tax=Jatrophihabitans sp. TaxID=1932789 RepID=UPI0030C757A8|nr:Phospholipid/cholesterol/gamma-HCH transport system substrate-binding protein [Jatrophihabitans sp.]
MNSLRGPIIKSVAFIVVTVLLTSVLALTITNGTSGGGHGYSAMFTDATSLNSGDDVRMAGVRVGQVTSVGLTKHTRGGGAPLARVKFTVQTDVALASTVTATIRYRNLIGQRYIELDEGSGSLRTPLRPGATLPLSATHPALDLTVLFNGFQPLFQALEPKEINELSGEIIQVFQGEGPTVQDLLDRTGSLTTTLADKDAVIGKVIDNLDSVVATIDTRGGELTTTISTLRQLVSGLTADRASIGSAITGISNLATDVGSVLSRGRAPLQASISGLGTLSKNLAGSNGALNSFLSTLPTKLQTIGRLASYGSWLNFYLCSVAGRIPTGGYYGSVGAEPVEARCQG